VRVVTASESLSQSGRGSVVSLRGRERQLAPERGIVEVEREENDAPSPSQPRWIYDPAIPSPRSICSTHAAPLTPSSLVAVLQVGERGVGECELPRSALSTVDGSILLRGAGWNRVRSWRSASGSSVAESGRSWASEESREEARWAGRRRRLLGGGGWVAQGEDEVASRLSSAQRRVRERAVRRAGRRPAARATTSLADAS